MNRALALVPLTLLLRADVCIDGLGFPGPFPSATETSTTKKLTLHLDREHAAQRFRIPLTMTPPSGGAHVDVIVNRATRLVRIEIADANVASTEPGGWTPVSTGFAGSVFLNGSETQDVVLAVGIDPFDLDSVADVDLELDVDVVFACPSDVDFDGVSDGVVVDIGQLDPVI